MYRLFISINLPPDLLAALTQVQDDLKRQLAAYPLRWSRPQGIHLTLKFLGNTDPARVQAIVGAIAAASAGVAPFDIGIGGLGCFPNPRTPRVLWVGVEEPTGALARLAADVDEQMAALGWQREKRPFSPHLTLARTRKDILSTQRRALGEALAALRYPVDLGHFRAEHVHLMRSQLHPGGAIYTSLARVALGGR